jgi:hypothetical protein
MCYASSVEDCRKNEDSNNVKCFVWQINGNRKCKSWENQWKEDTWGKTHHNSFFSEEKCMAQKTEYDHY